jgi:DNA-binding CsgD family transcriptional regulator
MQVSVEHFSRVVQSIYAAAMEPDSWEAALEEINSAVGSRISAILTTGRGLNEISVKSVGADPAGIAAYNDHYGRLDPIPLERMLTGVAAAQRQLVNRDEWERGDFFNAWAGPNGYGDGIFCVLSRDGARTSWLATAATPTRGPFGTPERVALVQALVPHLQHAIKTQGRLIDLDRRHRHFVSAIDVLPDGIAILGSDSRVLHLNPAAEAIVTSGDGLRVRSGQLIAAVARTDKVLGRVVHLANSDESTLATGGCVAVARPSGRRSYLVRVVPLASGDSICVASPTALVVIVDPEHETRPDVDVLRRLYGLTATEAAVALRVLAGTGVGPIAEELSLSPATVRTHLQRVFDKTDTHRQAELVRLLLGGLAATRGLNGSGAFAR